jgi:predicted nucleotidyltransferase
LKQASDILNRRNQSNFIWVYEMIAKQTINQAVQLLVRAAHPTKIILFGSYARGEASEDSDLDFLVILPTLSSKHQEMVRLRRALRPLRIPVDVLVASEDEVDEWGHLPSTTLYWALTEGKVLHEAAN